MLRSRLRSSARGAGRAAIITASVVLSCSLTASADSVASQGSPTAPITQTDWSTYMFGPSHSSVTADAGISPSDVATLTEAWHWTPPPATISGQPVAEIFGTPTVVGSTIYVGTNTGEFYALNLATGRVIWSRFLGYLPHYTCLERGISATASVVADPVSGALTVYAPGGDGYLYALDAGTGAQVWKSVIALPSPNTNDFYNWSSPTILNGRIYVGITSQCDNPLTQGGLREFDQHTGAVLATYHSVPDGVVGGGIWSSAAANDNGVYVTTGTPPPQGIPAGTDSVSVVRLDPTTLQREDGWAVPLFPPGKDQDFGASPVIFTADLDGTSTEMVGAMNKNGIFYAWKSHDLAAGPVWSVKIDDPAVPSTPAAVYDGSHLWVAGNQTTIAGTSYRGAIREIDPDSGTVLWETGLAGAVLGTPTLNGAGILAVPVYDYGAGVPNGVYLIDSATGAILRFLEISKGQEFAQPIWVGNRLLAGTVRRGLFAFSPSTALFDDGFEGGSLSNWSLVRNMSVETADTATGNYSAEAVGAGGVAAYAQHSLPSPFATSVTVSLRFKLVSQGTNAVILLGIRDSSAKAGKPIYTVSINKAGKITGHNALSGTTRIGSVVTIGTWHLLSVHLVNTPTGESAVTLDGVRLIPPSNDFETFGPASIGKIQIGDAAATHVFDVRFDDVSVGTP